jgi:hypothetical protein
MSNGSFQVPGQTFDIPPLSTGWPTTKNGVVKVFSSTQ